MHSLLQILTAMFLIGGSFGILAYSLEGAIHILLVLSVVWLCK